MRGDTEDKTTNLGRTPAEAVAERAGGRGRKGMGLGGRQWADEDAVRIGHATAWRLGHSTVRRQRRQCQVTVLSTPKQRSHSAQEGGSQQWHSVNCRLT